MSNEPLPAGRADALNAPVPQRVALLGFGAIGQAVQAAGSGADFSISGVLVRDPSRPRKGEMPPIFETLDALLASNPDVVVECAGHNALRIYGIPILRAGYDLIIVSVGALAETDLLSRLLQAAIEGKSRLRIASGAVGALDLLGAASVGGLSRVVHTIHKPAAAILGDREAKGLVEPRTVFSGPAREAATRFPQSVNSALAVAIAGMGPDQTIVRFVADPEAKVNSHVIEAEGKFGTMKITIENHPSADNPRTSALTAMSVVHLLRQRQALIAVG